MSSDTIRVRGAREHNLKNIDVDIPRDRLTVITGLSGSGKSSLAFDTIYAEGQRRYVESLSSYARQFLGQMDKPDLDSIDGLSPAISIDQKTTGRNPRSTVGTVTEIHDYFRLLWARTGIPHCPNCGREIRKQSVDEIVDAVMRYPEGTRMQVLAPVVRARKGEHRDILEKAAKNGYVRVRIDGAMYELDDTPELNKKQKHTIEVVVDRLIVRETKEFRQRLSDDIETAAGQSAGLIIMNRLSEEDPGEDLFSMNYACPECGISIEELTPRMFSFNSPFGACPVCDGLGTQMVISEEAIFPDEHLSLREGGLNAMGFDTGSGMASQYLKAMGKKYGFTMDTPVGKLKEDARRAILYGTGDEKLTIEYEGARGISQYSTAFEGVIPTMERRYRETASEGMREAYEEYMAEELCPACHGQRLKPEARAVTVGGKSLPEISDMSILECRRFFQNLQLDGNRAIIARQILKEIDSRLGFLADVGLGYLTLSRAAGSLSGGEAQRIRLATQIGSALMGVLYVLDEPSIGLHQRDNAKLIATLKKMRDLGNTVLVVEHDEETMYAADHIIDIGPGAGLHGGRLIAQGNVEEIKACPESITGQYLSGAKRIPVPSQRRKPAGWLKVFGAAENNLKHINVKVPLGVLCCVTGVSGSGKSSLVNEIIYQHLAKKLNRAKTRAGKFDSMEGLERLDKIIMIDQSPIGRTPRSNPATYTGMFDLIRKLYALSPEAKARGYKENRFSFNVKGGRCEACQGDGLQKIEMHFLPDLYVPCEVCHGQRYNRETLEVTWQGKNIYEVLEMTVEEALPFFENHPQIRRKLETLADVGLGYMKLGQSSTTLSGGEAQRVKLATELSRKATGRTIYLLDEPTTGLHMADVDKLISVLQRLTDAGNSVLVIEHNLDVIKVADWIIDLGPEGGDGGGTLVAEGTPEQVAKTKESYTGQYLQPLLEKQ
ncbi:MAG: excinuclease ABC subunit UvrA [Clostridia bacterium]|nr:excinuclease ABC subunit UvrA [Clostridia bacterium]MBR7173170.1 excinuclease ABC subunit UvrA [Clostridia bacterium]